jgi:hypothetical protein
MYTIHHRTSVSLEARLENPSTTYFQMKQATRSRCVSYIVLPPSVLWCNRQTEAYLVLRPKVRNYHSDFEAQITKLYLLVLKPKLENNHPWF